MGKMTIDLKATYEKMTLMLRRPEGIAAKVIFPTKEASRLAGNVLEAAKLAYQEVHKEPPKTAKGEKIWMSVVAPSGHNVGPAEKPKSTMMMFYFGETVLGIELPNADAETIARRILTLNAEGTAQ